MHGVGLLPNPFRALHGQTEADGALVGIYEQWGEPRGIFVGPFGHTHGLVLGSIRLAEGHGSHGAPAFPSHGVGPRKQLRGAEAVKRFCQRIRSDNCAVRQGEHASETFSVAFRRWCRPFCGGKIGKRYGRTLCVSTERVCY